MESNRKSIVREFCSSKFVNWYESRNLAEFDREYLIASLELLGDVTCVGFECIEIRRIQQEVPKSVSDTFERHFWYSQHNFSDLYLLKIPIAGKIAFILLISGIHNDGWDNSGSRIEILDEHGEFLGSGTLFHGEGFDWQDRPLNGEDFNTPAPSWIGDANESQVPKPEWEAQMRPIWTEKILTELAILSEREGGKTRYLMPVD